jgi:hypothetical protein
VTAEPPANHQSNVVRRAGRGKLLPINDRSYRECAGEDAHARTDVRVGALALRGHVT